MTILEEARPLSSSAKDDGDFIDLGWRPVFAEHVDRDGNRFTRSSMEKIAERCNERISETDDFVPVSLGHNKGGKDTEVVGFAGPFRIGEIGKKKKRAAIYGRFRVYKEDHHKIRKYPRLSVELWTSEKKPTEGYFDPISLLGSETPELDLGTRYSKAPRAGQRCVKYSAAFAGGTNVVLPGLVGEDKKPKTYEKTSGLMLSAEDIQQVVAARTPVCQSIVAEMNPAPQIGGDPLADDVEAGGNAEAAAGDDVPEMPPEMDVAEDSGDDVDKGDAPEVAEDFPEDKPEAPPVDAEDADEKPEEDDEPAVKKYQRERDEYQTKYQKAAAELRETSEKLDALTAEAEASKLEARRAVRYQKLSDLKAQGFVVDPNEEIADAQNLSESAFAKFTETVVKKYQRIPLNMIPVPKGIETDGDNDKKLVQYQKEAFALCETETKAGRYLPYREAVERVRKSYEAKAA